MPKALPFSDLSEKEIQELQKQAKTKREFQRVQCVYFRQRGISSGDIASVLAISPMTVKRIWAEYRQRGKKGFLKDHRGGRYHEHMTQSQEESFLSPFFGKAERGGMLLVHDVHEAYEDKIKKKVPKSTVYALLHRHGWRKIVPRPSHPKRNKSSQEIFKASFPPNRSVGGH